MCRALVPQRSRPLHCIGLLGEHQLCTRPQDLPKAGSSQSCDFSHPLISVFTKLKAKALAITTKEGMDFLSSAEVH